MMQQQSPATPKIIYLKDVPQENRKRFNTPLIIRLICEILVVSLIFLTIFLFALKWPTAQNIIHNKVLSNTRLAPSSDGFENWLDSPVTTTRDYRLFDIRNYMDIMTKSNSPQMEIAESEPMKYRLVIKKNNVKWLDDNTKIQYSMERFFTREGEFNEILLNQEGAFLDILRVMFRTKFDRVASPPFYVLGGNNAFNYSKAIDKLEGYISPIFAAISARMQGPNRDKYGFIYRYNGSNGFNFTIHSGIQDSSMKGQVVDFASEYTTFSTKADEWKTEFFDGLTFPPLGNPPNRKVINIFQPDFCRPIQLRYNRTISKFGFDAVHEYVLKLIDADKCPEMDENCVEYEKLDITRCLSAELPEETVVLTKPHFYGHNSNNTNVAFTPDSEKHESTVYFEPLTGTPLLVKSRVQLNANAWIDRIKIHDDGSTEPTQSRAVRRLVPILWIDQTVKLNIKVLDRLKLASMLIRTGQTAHQSMKLVYIFVALALVIAVIAAIELALWYRQYRKISQQEKPQKDRPTIFRPVSRKQEATIESNTNNLTGVDINTKELA